MRDMICESKQEKEKKLKTLFEQSVFYIIIMLYHNAIPWGQKCIVSMKPADVKKLSVPPKKIK